MGSLPFSLVPSTPFCLRSAEAGVRYPLLLCVECCCSYIETNLYFTQVSIKSGEVNDGARRWCLVFVLFYDWATSFIYVSGSCRCMGSTSAVNHQCLTRILTRGAVKPLNSLPLNLEGKQDEKLPTKDWLLRSRESEASRGHWSREDPFLFVQVPDVKPFAQRPQGHRATALCKTQHTASQHGSWGSSPSLHGVDVPSPLNLWHKWAYQVYSQSHLKNRLELIVPKITLQNYTGKQKGNNFRQSKQHDICQVD